jgi:hypothetical protein
MSNSLNFCSNFSFLLPISLANTETIYQWCIQVWHHDFSLFLFGEAKEKGFNGNWEQVLQIWKHIHWAFKYMNRLSMYWTPPERLWVCVNTNEWVGTAPEHPSSAHEHHWVGGNSLWTPIECTWMPLSECEHPLSPHDRHWVIIERDSPWYDHEKDHICVRAEQSLNTCECPWVPLRQYWTPPDLLVRMNTFEWVLNTPWTLVSAHEHQWVSGDISWTPIECARMPLSKYFKVLNAHL